MVDCLPDGAFRCIPRGKVIDARHVATAAHKGRLEQWQCDREMKTTSRPAPVLPYLAWAPFEESGAASERWLKCLLCNKWCQDESTFRAGQRGAGRALAPPVLPSSRERRRREASPSRGRMLWRVGKARWERVARDGVIQR